MVSGFTFKQFHINQSRCSQRVSTDACLFGAWVTERMGQPLTCLDIGAGTGLLMLMIAQRSSGSVHGIELEENCCQQLKENTMASPFADWLTVFEGDVRRFTFPTTYDLIICNPPYYEQQLHSPDEHRNKAWHSSTLRLEELFAVVQKWRATTGYFALILPFNRKQEAINHAASIGLFPHALAEIRHSMNHPVTRVLMIFSEEVGELLQETICIRNQDGSYSERMMELLGDYYLTISSA
jgi:tRNA1Val (adenine37-N6)-methyltransferase